MAIRRVNQKIAGNCPSDVLDYKNVKLLKRFVSEKGKLLSKRNTGLNCKEQRSLEIAVKRARYMALLPYISY